MKRSQFLRSLTQGDEDGDIMLALSRDNDFESKVQLSPEPISDEIPKPSLTELQDFEEIVNENNGESSYNFTLLEDSKISIDGFSSTSLVPDEKHFADNNEIVVAKQFTPIVEKQYDTPNINNEIKFVTENFLNQENISPTYHKTSYKSLIFNESKVHNNTNEDIVSDGKVKTPDSVTLNSRVVKVFEATLIENQNKETQFPKSTHHNHSRTKKEGIKTRTLGNVNLELDKKFETSMKDRKLFSPISNITTSDYSEDDILSEKEFSLDYSTDVTDQSENSQSGNSFVPYSNTIELKQKRAAKEVIQKISKDFANRSVTSTPNKEMSEERYITFTKDESKDIDSTPSFDELKKIFDKEKVSKNIAINEI